MAIDPSSAGKSLINLGDLSKPATTLIEKVSDAVGGIAKPWQIVRIAKAKAEVDIIRAQSRIDISEMEQRALVRMVREEGNKQENIESITAQAIPLLSQEAKPENVEDDWITHFFDKARLVSDAEMQSLWSRILAGEANKPHTFAKKTVDLVATLDKSDALLFSKFCTFVWMIGSLAPIIFDVSESMLANAGINFMTLNHLDDIGLITFGNIMTYSRNGLPKYMPVFYYGRAVTIEFPSDLNNLQIGKVILTRAGEQLAAICGSEPSDDYFQSVLKRWYDQDYVLSMPIIARPRKAQ
jgi:hypothetical protein